MAHATGTLSSFAFALGLCLAASPARAQPAFPGAEGFGAGATGGRGGVVLHVTTLDASGAGSLAWAAAQSGARYVVFDVSGVIDGDVQISSSDITIAGQTAPGAGITIHGHLTTPYGSDVGNIIIRHLRVRPPEADSNWPATQHDAIQMSSTHRLILDHVSASHGIDETLDLWDAASQITVQWSAITFPNPDGGHPDGAHNFGMIAAGDSTAGGRISVHHNLFAHCRTRTPALSVGPAETVNNVVYNGREGFVHHNAAYGEFVIAGNTYRDGPSHSLAPFWFDPENSAPVPSSYYLGDNRVDDPGVFEGIVQDPHTTVDFDYTFKLESLQASQFHAIGEAPDWSSITGYLAVTRAATDTAYNSVLDCSGAWPRDFVDTTAVKETRARNGMQRNLPLTDLLAGLSPGTAATDTDSDGMPDAWESAHGRNPSVADHQVLMPSGYPAIEEYINQLADSLTPCATTPPGPTPDAGVPSGDAGNSGNSGDAGAGNPGDAANSGGCGCRTAAGDAGPWGQSLGLLALIALIAFVAWRRPRRRLHDRC